MQKKRKEMKERNEMKTITWRKQRLRTGQLRKLNPQADKERYCIHVTKARCYKKEPSENQKELFKIKNDSRNEKLNSKYERLMWVHI